RQPKPASGPDGSRYLYVGDIQLARVVPARVAFSDVGAWAGSPDRADWTVLLLRDPANAAAEDDDAWEGFLEALRAILHGHPQWRVTCESDCDQYPVEMLELTPDTLVSLLDSYRSTRHFPIAFCSEWAGLHH